MKVQEVIRRPLITEKSTELREATNTIAFEVHRRANKVDVARAVLTQFQRKVAEVRIVNVHGKVRRQGKYSGRRPDWKKAYVRLVEGEKPIEFFEGM
jgi:large subunit ribosomal protein L23